MINARRSQTRRSATGRRQRGAAGESQQAEFSGPADRRAAVLNAKLRYTARWWVFTVLSET